MGADGAVNAPVSSATAVWPRIEIRDLRLDYPVITDRSSIKSLLFTLLGFRTGPKITQRNVSALRGLSVTIDRGERVGIVGRNGAGKSTLLRAIGGIYPIEAGSIDVTGRIHGLFDLGTGFEPEATGRENISYRGLSIGATPKQIAERTDEIIAFADIGEFIDLPMRTYSAGMFVRLGFAISTYVEGEILLIDEIFGAGDAAFQDKARQRMLEMIDRAGIMMLVSHDLHLLVSMCTRLIWLDGGQLMMDGDPMEVAEAYIQSTRA